MRTKAETMQGLITKYLPKDPDEAKAFMYELDILLMRYESAIREVRTKLEIFEKLERQGDELTLSSIQENLNDVAGIRVICGFIDDIYKVAKMLARQDDVRLIQVKDYIKNPKPNGYRSYHMIIEIPVFFSDEKLPMRVEVQIRTVAMNYWASLEHKMKYKQDIENAAEIMDMLKECADTIAETDKKMLAIREMIPIKS